MVDDDSVLCDLLADFLGPEGFEVEAVGDGIRGVERALSGDHAIVVLDVMLPGLNGFDALRRIRARSGIPILMLTARGDEFDRVVGLEIGADDYLPKPFNPRELAARIRAILRRTSDTASRWPGAAPADRLAVGDVHMDVNARVVRRNGETIGLTGVEFGLLEILLRSAGSVVSREVLSKDVLGRRLTHYDRSLDMHISNLRKKLGHKTGGTERIKTIRGVGYVYAIVTETP